MRTDRRYRSAGVSQPITEALVADAAALLAAHGAPDELVVRDPTLRGFVVRLRASGRHSYGAAWGRGRTLKLGTSDKLTAGKARRAAREALAQANLKGAPDLAAAKRARLTLRGFLTDTYRDWALKHLRTGAETLARLERSFAAVLDLRLVDLTAFRVEAWRTARLKGGASKSTVNRDVDDLKACLRRAVAWGHLASYPLAAVKRYRLDRAPVVRYLTPDEETRFLTALEDRDAARVAKRASANAWRRARGYPELPSYGPYTDHVRPFLLLALHTGCRRGELLAATWGDVDVVRAVLTVRGHHAKSGQTRHVPLNATALATLNAWRPDPAPAAEALVFPGVDGRAIADLKSAWRTVTTAADLKAFRLHDLRHTFASKLVQAGVDLNTVRELLGHADLKMTIRYSHLAPDLKAAAVARLVSAS